MQVGIGVTYLSGTDDILTGAVAQKQFFFGPTLNPLSLKLKAQADYNTQTQQVTLIGLTSHTDISLDCNLFGACPAARHKGVPLGCSFTMQNQYRAQGAAHPVKHCVASILMQSHGCNVCQLVLSVSSNLPLFC